MFSASRPYSTDRRRRPESPTPCPGSRIGRDVPHPCLPASIRKAGSRFESALGAPTSMTFGVRGETAPHANASAGPGLAGDDPARASRTSAVRADTASRAGKRRSSSLSRRNETGIIGAESAAVRRNGPRADGRTRTGPAPAQPVSETRRCRTGGRRADEPRRAVEGASTTTTLRRGTCRTRRDGPRPC